MLAPGYYHMECQTKEDCTKKNPKSFCHMFMCVDCLKENVACTQNGQCCDGTECIYGRCKKGAKKDPGNNIYSRKNPVILMKNHLTTLILMLLQK